MALVSALDLMLEAQKGGYAIGAFNIENMETAQAVAQAAQETGMPVIIQTTPASIRYAGIGMFHAMVKELADHTDARIALHLDHGDSLETAQKAVAAGYTSVMIDGSKLPFEENIALTKRVVAMADGVPVEAELGTVGGKEDDTVAGCGGYTQPEDAKEFVKRTNVAMLAVAIGTAHGVYKGVPKLDIPRLSKIRSLVDIPLVLHGASGVPEDQVRVCVKEGICKVNYATELRQAYTRGTKEAIAANPDAFDPKLYGKAARAAVVEAVKLRINLLRP